MLISILIDVQYLQNDVFYFVKGLNGQMHSSSDAHHLIKISTSSKISHSPSTTGGLGGILSTHPLTLRGKPWSGISRGVFWYTFNYTTSGHMLNADSHLMD